MATKKLKFLTQADRQVILDLEAGNPGTVASIEQTGQIPQAYIDKINSIIAEKQSPQSVASAQAHLTQIQQIVGVN